MNPPDSSQGAALSPVRIKRYATGKYYLFADAAAEHHDLVHQALVKAAKVCIDFDDEIFRTTLRSAGIPEAAIETYLDSVRFIDDIFGCGRNLG